MTTHGLVVCKSCGFAVDEKKRDGETGDAHLLKHLEALHEQWPRRDELAIAPTGCLCICEKPCAIAYVGTGKPTYSGVQANQAQSQPANRGLSSLSVLNHPTYRYISSPTSTPPPAPPTCSPPPSSTSTAKTAWSRPTVCHRISSPVASLAFRPTLK